jgi:chaperone modulatory protein CbpM
MIGIDVLITQVSGLQRQDLERWISNDWVKPDRHSDSYMFVEIDVARVRLIQELRDEMGVNEAALPVVLSLLDQLYDLRRRMHELSAAISQTVPTDARGDLMKYLEKRSLKYITS